MKSNRVLLFSVCLAASMSAFAQYQWIDKDGRRVFSDRPPPASEQVRDVRNKPMRGNAAATSITPSESAASAPAAAASAAPGVDKTLQARKQQAEAEAAAKKKAEDDKHAAARAENCQRARSAKASLDAGYRVAQVNAKGEREVMDDAQRQAESRRLQGIIDQDCR